MSVNFKQKVINIMGLKDYQNDKEIKKLWKEINKKIQLAHEQGRYSFFENTYSKQMLTAATKENNYEALQYIYNMIDTWDKECKLSEDAGNYLESLCFQNDRTIAIHRTNIGPLTDEYGVPINNNLLDIIQRGIVNLGHANVGGNVGIPDPSLTVTPLANFTGFVNLFGLYKNNNVTIVTSFPKEYVLDDCSLSDLKNANNIYDIINGTPYIKPEYIEAVIFKNPDGLDLLYKRSDILEKLSKNISR